MTLLRCALYHPHWDFGCWFICFPHEVCVCVCVRARAYTATQAMVLVGGCKMTGYNIKARKLPHFPL